MRGYILLAFLLTAAAWWSIMRRFPTPRVATWHRGQVGLVWVASVVAFLVVTRIMTTMRFDSSEPLSTYALVGLLLGVWAGAMGTPLVLTWRWFSTRPR